MKKMRNEKKQTLVLSIFAHLWLKNVSLTLAAPCPVETTLYGGATLNGSSDEVNEYFAVIDDDFTRVTKLRYCKCCINSSGFYEHFRGLEVTINSPTSGSSV